MKLEKELVAQLWRISWDNIQISNFDKVLRSGSKLTLSLVSTHTHSHRQVHTHVHTLTGVCVSVSTERIHLRLPDDQRREPAGVCKDGILQGQPCIFIV